MLKIAVENFTGVVNGFSIYWAPMELSITTYVCMGKGNSYIEKSKESLQNFIRDAKVVAIIPKISIHSLFWRKIGLIVY